MNIFANLTMPKRQREIIILFGKDFCDFQLLREKIHQFRYDSEDIIFIRHTQLLNESQEQILDDFLRKELGSKYSFRNYKPTVHYVEKGQHCVACFHQHLECYVFTSDHTEQDIAELNESAKKLTGWTCIERRPTTQEINERIKRDKINAIKDVVANTGVFFGVVAFWAFIILSCIFINEHKEIMTIIGAIIGIAFILFVLFVVWSFVSENKINRWSTILKTIDITFFIFALLILIGYLMPDSCSNYVNDAHRPDRF